MHGGVKVYRGAPAAARNYVEADRSRADDYYLGEGTGIARRFSAGPDGPVTELMALTGDGYEAWVAGLDPDTGEPRGRLRSDPRAVRFVEVTVNGPKSWSLAAELHPDIAAAYEAAQDRAAAQVIGWLAQHATTRVGPRGAQVAVPVERLEAVTVRHYTSRAGDPHRHLHLQINARVFAAGQVARDGHGRGAGLDQCDQRHRARRGRDRPGVPGRARRPRLHPGRGRGDRAARGVRGPVLSAGRADRGATSTATKPTGAASTQASNPVERSGGRGMRAPGPTRDRTRSAEPWRATARPLAG